MTAGNDDLVRTLEELIAALDRRMPHLEREGEDTIVRDAAILREKAVSRLMDLTGRVGARPGVSSTSGDASR